MATGRDQRTEDRPRVQYDLSTKRSQPRLRWRDEAGAHEALLAPRTLLGSSPHLAVVVADRSVSRLHAELEVRANGVWIRDLGSKNGTFIREVRVESALLADHATFECGGTAFEVDYAGRSENVPLWPVDHFGQLIACSQVMRELFVRLAQYARSQAPVLVQGETGTGKELVARAIPDASDRQKGPFVVVDCAALSESLLESELFGHAAGFAAAAGAREGAFEAASGGTLFLDELGELPLAMQAKLLRTLESGEVRRVGETEPRKVDVRFIAATHRDLSAMVSTEAFREDLYFRLLALPAYVPPLRTRRDDIPLLLAHFLGAEPDAAVVAAATAQPWLGNARELYAFAERVRALGAEGALSVLRGDLAAPAEAPAAPAPASPASPSPAPASSSFDLNVPYKHLRDEWMDRFERDYLTALIKEFGSSTQTLAQRAGIDESYVRRLRRRHER